MQKPVINLLKWICFSLGPLSVDEAAEIFILDAENDIPFDPDDRLLFPEAVLDYLPNLVVKRRGLWELTRYIEIAHFSIKEYILSQRITERQSKDFHFQEKDAHLHIANSCLAYHLHLSQNISVTSETESEYKLWNYTSHYWDYHFSKVENETLPTILKDRVVALLDGNSPAFCNLYRLAIPRTISELPSEELCPPLLYFAGRDSLWPIKYMVERGDDVNEVRDSSVDCCHALQYAIQRNKWENAKFLVCKGADINAQAGSLGNALQAAVAFGGSCDFLQLLLDNGANINAQGGIYGNALQAATAVGAAEIFQFLVSHGADINAQGGCFGNALQAAGVHGIRRIAFILNRSGVGCDVEPWAFADSLYEAICGGDFSNIRLLLNKKVDINAQQRQSEYASEAETAFDEFGIIKMLIDRGADVRGQGIEFKNMVHAAALLRNSDITKLLIDRGAGF